MISESKLALDFLKKIVNRRVDVFKLILKKKKKNVIEIMEMIEIFSSYRCCKRMFQTFTVNVERMQASRKLELIGSILI